MITGFPSPAQGYEDDGIDLNSLLVKHPAATVLMKIDTGRYSRVCVFPGDLLIVDRSLSPQPGDMVVYEEEGEFRLGLKKLIPPEREVCGVVTNVIHSVRRSG